MHTIKIVSTCEPTKDTINGETYTLIKGVTEVSVSFWIGYKARHKNHIEGHHVFPEDKPGEENAILEFKGACFSEFESLGIPAVRVSSEKGELSKGVKHSFALEWLESKSESRELSREEREEESLSISRNALRISDEANKLARRAIMWAAIAALIATIAMAVQYHG
jgi:hypothetical protein